MKIFVLIFIAIVSAQTCNNCPGPAPAAPNGLCEDGTTVFGPVCKRVVGGRCQWQIVSADDVCPERQCQYGKRYNSCGSACPLTCELPDPRPCTKQCVAGCYCTNGLLESGDGCVRREQCPPRRPDCRAVRCRAPMCPESLQFTPPDQCCVQCRSPCANGQAPLPEPVNCRTQRCPGDSTCIADPLDRFAVCCPSSCAAVLCPVPECGRDQLFTPEGECCPQCQQLVCPTGQSPVPDVSCRIGDCPEGSNCVTAPDDSYAVCCRRLIGGDVDEHGCRPSAGYIWCEAGSRCVRPWEEPEESACSTGNLFPCGGPCEAGNECDVLTHHCTPVSCDAANACPAGQICEHKEKFCARAPCPQFDCHEPCTGGKVWNDCASNCPHSCQTPPPEVCSFLCVARCDCPEGTTYDEVSEQCVSTCPVRVCRQLCVRGTTCHNGECVPITCEAPNACPPGKTCVYTRRVCITEPCQQFDCQQVCPSCPATCQRNNGNGNGHGQNKCSGDSECMKLSEGDPDNCECPIFECVKIRGCPRTECSPPRSGCRRLANTVDRNRCLKCGEVVCDRP